MDSARSRLDKIERVAGRRALQAKSPAFDYPAYKAACEADRAEWLARLPNLTAAEQFAFKCERFRAALAVSYPAMVASWDKQRGTVTQSYAEVVATYTKLNDDRAQGGDPS